MQIKIDETTKRTGLVWTMAVICAERGVKEGKTPRFIIRWNCFPHFGGREGREGGEKTERLRVFYRFTIKIHEREDRPTWTSGLDIQSTFSFCHLKFFWEGICALH